MIQFRKNVPLLSFFRLFCSYFYILAGQLHVVEDPLSVHVGATCIYEEQVYKPQQLFPSSDGCNTCRCSDAGRVHCTDTVCPAKSNQSKSKKDCSIFSCWYLNSSLAYFFLALEFLLSAVSKMLVLNCNKGSVQSVLISFCLTLILYNKMYSMIKYTSNRYAITV